MKSKELAKKITVTSLVVYYISTVVGAGIFLVPMQAAKLAGPASLISWLLVLFMVYPFARIFAYISQEYQSSGSVQEFLEQATSKSFGRAMTLFIAISAMIGNFLLAYVSAEYALTLFDISEGYILHITMFLLILSCTFNFLKIGISSFIQTICLMFLITLLILIVFLSVPFYQSSHLDNFMPHGFEPVISTILLCFYSVVGWENTGSMAEEVHNPKKTYARAINIAILLIGLLYISIAITVIMVIPQHVLHESGNTWLSILLTQEFGEYAGKAGSLIAIVLLFLGANSWILGTSRMLFALARSKALPKFLAKVTAKTEIPTAAIVVQIPCYFMIAYLMYVRNLGDQLLEIAGMNYLIFYMIVFSCAVTAFKEKKMQRLAVFALMSAIALLMDCANFQSVYSLGILLMSVIYIFFKEGRK